MEVLNAALTLLGDLITAYLSFRLGQQQLTQTARSTEKIDKTTGETEFRNSLLELIDSQEDKITRQDAKIERLDSQIDQSRTLTDELQRANFTITLENQRMTRLIQDLETEVSRLNKAVSELKQKQIKQEVYNETHK